MSFTFSKIINLTTEKAMQEDKSIISFGLGVTDPKGIFGTTIGLKEKFGSSRVFDVPASENALTGFAIGSSLNGLKPILVHQRLDFALLSMDQIINSAAKWLYMFGGTQNVPITIRMIIGRGWGQGPTHSQNLHSIFAHIPGLKVVVPALASDVSNLFYSAIHDPNPVIFLEHRWLHNSQGEMPKRLKKNEIGKCKIVKKGNDITVISLSYMTVECIEAAKILEKIFSVSIEVVDIRTVNPLDISTIVKSIKRTKKTLIVDTSNEVCGFSPSLLSQILKNIKNLKMIPEIMAMPFAPEPTSYGLTKHFYNNRFDVVNKVLKILKIDKKINNDVIDHHDVPGDWFKGPF
jgi:acetoin:2,6-dichlorophenolindophenol oxidoreductase subunit beta